MIDSYFYFQGIMLLELVIPIAFALEMNFSFQDESKEYTKKRCVCGTARLFEVVPDALECALRWALLQDHIPFLFVVIQIGTEE
jgi:hypothetical protein